MEKTEKNTTFVVNETSKASSYEFGKAGNRFKIYFGEVDDLYKQMEQLNKKGLILDEEMPVPKKEKSVEKGEKPDSADIPYPRGHNWEGLTPNQVNEAYKQEEKK